jgi:hypothetical protein
VVTSAEGVVHKSRGGGGKRGGGYRLEDAEQAVGLCLSFNGPRVRGEQVVE